MRLTDTLTLFGIVAQGLVDLVLWIRVSWTDGQTRRRLLRIASVLLVIFLGSGISGLSKLPMPLTTLIALIATAAIGLVDLVLWIQWFRASEETRRQLLGLAIALLFLFIGYGATALSTFFG